MVIFIHVGMYMNVNIYIQTDTSKKYTMLIKILMNEKVFCNIKEWQGLEWRKGTRYVINLLQSQDTKEIIINNDK